VRELAGAVVFVCAAPRVCDECVRCWLRRFWVILVTSGVWLAALCAGDDALLRSLVRVDLVRCVPSVCRSLAPCIRWLAASRTLAALVA
jgi:hypothetical protein